MERILSYKISRIEHALKRIDEVYNNTPSKLTKLTEQDSIVINMVRCYETSMDLIYHVIGEKKLGIPKNKEDAISILERDDVIDKDLAISLYKVAGFCRQAFKTDRIEDTTILESILTKHIDDFKKFTKIILQHEAK